VSELLLLWASHLPFEAKCKEDKRLLIQPGTTAYPYGGGGIFATPGSNRPRIVPARKGKLPPVPGGRRSPAYIIGSNKRTTWMARCSVGFQPFISLGERFPTPRLRPATPAKPPISFNSSNEPIELARLTRLYTRPKKKENAVCRSTLRKTTNCTITTRTVA
jgi:hypothetical protein